MIQYTIPIAPVTKKNHQQILRTADGRPFIAPSKQYRQYAKKAGHYLGPVPPKPISEPVNVRCLFYLPTKRTTDLVNLLQAVDDVMVENGILEDDNYKILASHDGSRCYVDRENPRTEIYIERMNDL